MIRLGEWLEHDHQRIDDLWDRAAAAWESSPAESRSLYGLFLEGLLRHLAAEEELVFPFFEAQSSRASTPLTEILREEHVEIRAAAAVLRAKIERGDGEPVDAALALRNVLWEHNAREEAQLYPWLERTSAEGEGEDVARRVLERISGPGSPA